MKTKYFLGIETSCDDTSASIIKRENGKNEVLSLLSFDQTQELKKWNGVVPEVAARNHLEKITPTIYEVLNQAKIEVKDLTCIGVTAYPGLLGPLLTGINAAKTLALVHEKPILPVNHLYAHLEAIHLTEDVSYPYLGVLLSGGHSLFLEVKSSTEMKVLGGTIDDAAGEAFDKGGKLLGLGYPAGPIIDRIAKWGDKKAYDFPIGLKQSANADLSFSGLKTSLRVFLEKTPIEIPLGFEKEDPRFKKLYDTSASYQYSIARAIELKLRYALKASSNKNMPIVIGGGVACNSQIREVLKEKYSNTFFVAPKYCTDNGAMIANYTALNFENAISFPECLSIDGKSRFIQKAKNV